MNTKARLLAILVSTAALPACITYHGDKMLGLQNVTSTSDQQNIMLQAKESVKQLLTRLELPAERKAALEKINPVGVIHDDAALDVNHAMDQLVIAKGDVNIAYAVSSIIIAGGATHISHSGNNIVISAGDIDIGHDGRLPSLVSGFGDHGGGSLVVSKGKVKISHATKTIVYAVKGVTISHAKQVRTFNTADRKVSWGLVNNVVIEPLFRSEATSR